MKKIAIIIWIALWTMLMCATCALAEEAAVNIVFTSEGIVAPAGTVQVDGHTVTLRLRGTYAFSGELENGQIIVDAGGKDTVTLILSGVTVTHDTLPALKVENAGLTVLRLAEGTENVLISGTTVDVMSNPADPAAEGGAIHARDDLRIEGDGALTVGGYINNGIHTSNNLTIAGGVITVEAVNHGVKGKDSVLIEGGALTIASGKDGITSDDTTGEGYGVVSIRGGSLNIVSNGDGIQAETLLDVSGGVLNVTSGGGSADAEYDEPDDWGGWRGGFGFGYDQGDSKSDGLSTKGLKSGAALRISGGEITVDAADDAVHANGDITIAGGTLILSTGDDGVHADNSLTVEDGVITVLASYEGMEANQLLIAGGVIDITSADDGLNAYGGQSMFGMGGGDRGDFGGNRGGFGGGRGDFGGNRGGFGGPGEVQREEAPDEAPKEAPKEAPEEAAKEAPEDMPLLRITGGLVHINAEGDGLDSNGNIVVEGGEVIVDGPFRSMNGAIDVGSENGGTCEVHGGTVLAIGAAGMAETFGSTSTQCAFHVMMQGIAAGTEIVITDSEGTVLYRHTAAKACSSVVFTCPELTLGETYTVTAGEQSVQVTQSSVSVGSGGQSMRRGW